MDAAQGSRTPGHGVRVLPVWMPDRVSGLDAVIALERRGTQGAFIVVDDITLDPARLAEPCVMIAPEGLDRMACVMQASVRWVFPGIESGSARSLASMRERVDRDEAREAVGRLRGRLFRSRHRW